MANAKNPDFVRDIETAERDAQIARYWTGGRTCAETATHFGIHKSSVSRARQRAIDAAIVPAGQEAIAAELVKLDALEEAAWTVLRANHIHVSDGRVVKDDGAPITDHKPVLMAIDRLVKISESRRRLLGLDAPTKQTVTVITEDVVDAEIRRLENEMEALNASPRQA